MYKYLILCLFLIGCLRHSEDLTEEYVLPPGMLDCKVFTVSGKSINKTTLIVIRCPNSSTTTVYKTNKIQRQITVIN